MKKRADIPASKIVGIALILCIVLTLSACDASTVKNNQKLTMSSDETLELEVPTPPEQIDLVKAKVEEEMRVFDVVAHHEALYREIKNIPESVDSEQIKLEISDIVNQYMDEYFHQIIGNILLEYNDKYMASEVETIFDSTSRAALYELITLYEYTFYENNH
ncbi:hypothetical protein [Fusibacter bizertensis]